MAYIAIQLVQGLYIYIPLGGSKIPTFRWCINILIVFLISGLWHGANWTFVIWGGLQGIFILLSRFTSKISHFLYTKTGLIKIPSIIKLVKVLSTFLLVCFGWIFFRANNIKDAFYIINNLFSGFVNMPNFFKEFINADNILDIFGLIFLGKSSIEFVVVVFSIGFMLFVEFFQRKRDVIESLSLKSWWVRWPIYYAFILWVLFFGVFDKSPFIYFQF